MCAVLPHLALKQTHGLKLDTPTADSTDQGAVNRTPPGSRVLKFLLSLLGVLQPHRKLPVDARVRVPARDSAPSKPAPRQPATSGPAPGQFGSTLLLREEMLDHRGRLAGHRVGAPTSGQGHAGLLQALMASQVQRQAERRWVLIDLQGGWPHPWQDSDWRGLVQQHTVVQLAAADAPHAPALRQRGAGVALRWNGATPEPPVLTPALTHIVLSLRQDPLQLIEQRLQHLRRTQPHLQVVVEDVGTWAEQRLCVAQGAHLVMGPFLTTLDEHGAQEPVSPGRLVLMDMLQALRQDADNAALAELAKRDPGIAVQLLSMVNSPAFGLSQPLSSLDQAMTVLGRDALYRWLSVSLFAGGRERPHDLALLEMALTRARFMEQLGRAHGTPGQPGQADELFLVGLLSFVDRLLGLPLNDLLQRMAVPQAVADVLLHSQGPHAPWMLLALAMERCDADRLLRIAQAQGLPPGDFARWRDEAVLWAADAVH